MIMEGALTFVILQYLILFSFSKHMAQEFIRPTPYTSCDEENMGKCNSFDRIGDSQHEFIRIDLQDDIHYLRTGDIAKVIFDCTTMYGQGFVLRDEYLKNYDPVTHNVSFYVRIPERGDEMVRRNGESGESVLINKDALFERGSSGGSGEIGETEIGGEAESKSNVDQLILEKVNRIIGEGSGGTFLTDDFRKLPKTCLVKPDPEDASEFISKSKVKLNRRADIFAMEPYTLGPARCLPCKHVFATPLLHCWLNENDADIEQNMDPDVGGLLGLPHRECPECRATIVKVEILSVAQAQNWDQYESMALEEEEKLKAELDNLKNSAEYRQYLSNVSAAEIALKHAQEKLEEEEIERAIGFSCVEKPKNCKKHKKDKEYTGESKNNESKSNSLEQLVNMGIPIEEASELLESVDGNVEIAAGLFYSGSTPRKGGGGGGGEQKSDDIDDEDGEYITGEAIKIKSLYKSITLEEAKGIVLEAEIAADDIVKELPDYTDKFNDVYQSFIVELAMNLVQSKMSTDAGDETDDEEDVSLEDLASAAYAAEKALQKKIEIKGGGEKKSMEIMEQSVASGVGRYALKDAVLSMDPRGDMISALSAKISYIEEEVDWARGVHEPEIMEPYIREFTNAAFAYLKRQMRDYFSDHSKAHRPMLRASSSDMPRVSVLLRGASTGRSSEEIERLKESIHHKIRELERKQQRNEEPQNKTINSQVKKLKSDLARLEMDLETTKADLKR